MINTCRDSIERGRTPGTIAVASLDAVYEQVRVSTSLAVVRELAETPDMSAGASFFYVYESRQSIFEEKSFIVSIRILYIDETFNRL